jgi:hypothetical protein
VEQGELGLERRDYLLGVLAELVAHGGAAPLLAPPVMPGSEAFPEAWQPTPSGVTTLLRRLAWHADQRWRIKVVDERRAALATERKPETQLELKEIRKGEIMLTLSYVGEDDVAGTLAHEIGLAHAMVVRIDAKDPYRSAADTVVTVDAERDLDRGSIATVYLGLGVLAANAAYQQYSRSGPWTGGYFPLEYDVVRAGYVSMSELAYLLAVQAVVRGAASPPEGLQSVQRDEVLTWLAALRDRSAELRARLNIAADATGVAARPAVEPLAEADIDEPRSTPKVDDAVSASRRAFRWRGHRGFFGFAIGALAALALVIVFSISGHQLRATPMLLCLGIGAVVGRMVGRRIQIARCSECATVVDVRASQCRKCGATFHGDITALSQRLEAAERLEEQEARDREAR